MKMHLKRFFFKIQFSNLADYYLEIKNSLSTAAEKRRTCKDLLMW